MALTMILLFLGTILAPAISGDNGKDPALENRAPSNTAGESSRSSGSASTSFTYGPLGNRISSTDINSDTTFHLYEGTNVIQDRQQDGTLTREYVSGIGSKLAMIDHTDNGNKPAGEIEVLYYLHDILGSVVALINAGGSVVERYYYNPYGETNITDSTGITERSESAFGNTYMWTGKQYDSENDLYHFPARSYSPSLGRWLQRDPLGYVDGLNLYEYVRSSPMNFVDPLGLWPIDDPPGFAEWRFDPDWDKSKESYRNALAAPVKYVFTGQIVLDILKGAIRGSNGFSDRPLSDWEQYHYQTNFLDTLGTLVGLGALTFGRKTLATVASEIYAGGLMPAGIGIRRIVSNKANVGWNKLFKPKTPGPGNIIKKGSEPLHTPIDPLDRFDNSLRGIWDDVVVIGDVDEIGQHTIKTIDRVRMSKSESVLQIVRHKRETTGILHVMKVESENSFMINIATAEWKVRTSLMESGIAEGLLKVDITDLAGTGNFMTALDTLLDKMGYIKIVMPDNRGILGRRILVVD